MRLLKFHGRTIETALAKVKKELGDDALIVETRSISPGSATERLYPGAKFEVTAAVDRTITEVRAQAAYKEAALLSAPGTNSKTREPFLNLAEDNGSAAASESEASIDEQPFAPKPETEPRTFGEWVKQRVQVAGEPADAVVDRLVGPTFSTKQESPLPNTNRTLPRSVLQDLALLKSQVRDLLEEGRVPSQRDVRTQADLSDYRYLLDQGIEPAILAGPFRRWLNWRTSDSFSLDEALPFEPNRVMQGQGLREWLWNEWHLNLSLPKTSNPSLQSAQTGLTLMGFVGGPGVGKTTTLAKFASKNRVQSRKKVAVLSLGSSQIGSDDSWRRLAKLMDVCLIEAVTQEDVGKSVQLFDRFDWIGIDTPAGMTAESHAGRLYGFLLAQRQDVKTSLVVEASNRDRVNQAQIEKMQFTKPDRLIFTKLDETPQRGGILNLTFGKSWGIEAASSGRRVPEDFEAATPEALWQWVFARDGAPTMTAKEGAL